MDALNLFMILITIVWCVMVIVFGVAYVKRFRAVRIDKEVRDISQNIGHVIARLSAIESYARSWSRRD